MTPSFETQHIDRKSLRIVVGQSADWSEVAKDCVAFANGEGGRLLIGIEDGEILPPADQVIPPDLPETIRKRVGERTRNVQVLPMMRTDDNGGEYIEVMVDRSPSVASTTDGRFYQRVGDTCQPIVGDDIMRLANDRPGVPWESMDSRVPKDRIDDAKVERFVEAIRASDRVKDSVKEKSPHELLAHYGLSRGATLTHLGVLLLGTTEDRRALGVAPVIQAIKYDELGQKINKWVWDENSLSPVELVDAVWREVPDFRETYEVPEGLYRPRVPAYDEKVIRELLVNALVHRPYTQRGDIFLNLHPDRLEVVNPGRLPLGVTPRNILHASRRRNGELARVFHDLVLMEREGSGLDLVYDLLLSKGRPAPRVEEGSDSVKVTILRRIVKPAVMRLLTEADARLQLTQRERITLGFLAQTEGMTARDLMEVLEIEFQAGSLQIWLGRLLDFHLLLTSGRTKGTRYFVDPMLLKDFGVKLPTSLVRIEPHRLLALVREDLRRYPRSKFGEISDRIGPEVPHSRLKRTLAELVRSKNIVMEGQRGGARYSLNSKDA